MRTRLAYWPIRLMRRGRYWNVLLYGKVQTGITRHGARLYSWWLCLGPLKLVVGQSLRRQRCEV